MKKSLLITLDFPPKKGGVSHQLFNIASHLPHQKIAVLTQTSDQSIKTPYPIYRRKLLSTLKFIWPKWIFLFWQVKKIIKKESIDLIQAGQILPIGTVALIYKKFWNIPYFVYVYGMDLVTVRNSARKMRLIRSILINANGVMANSTHTKNLAIKLGADNNKTIVVYPCPHNLGPEQVNELKLQEFINKNHLAGKKVILSVGNLVKRKGHDKVIRSLPIVIKKIPNLIYAIVGAGPEKNRLEQEVINLNLESYVHFFNQVPDRELVYFYQACDVLVMPSRELKNDQGETIDVEGFGMVFLEANLFEKPVIGGKSGGQPDAIEDGYSGLLVNPNDENEIANAIIKLLESPELAEKLGQQGRQRVLEKFRWDKEAKKIINLLS